MKLRLIFILLLFLASYVSPSHFGGRNLKRSYEDVSTSSRDDEHDRKRHRTEFFSDKMPVIQTIIQEMIEQNKVSPDNLVAWLGKGKDSLRVEKIFSNVYSLEYLGNLVGLLSQSTVDPLEFVEFLYRVTELQEPLLFNAVQLFIEHFKLNNANILELLKIAFIQKYFKLVETIAKEYVHHIGDDFLSFLVKRYSHPNERDSVETTFKIFSLVPAYVPFYSAELLLIMVKYGISDTNTDRIFELMSMDCSVFDAELLRNLIFSSCVYSKPMLDYFKRCNPEYKFQIPVLNEILASDNDMIEGLIVTGVFAETSLENFNYTLEDDPSIISSLKVFKSVLIHYKQLEIEPTELLFSTLQDGTFTRQEKKDLVKEFISLVPDFSSFPPLIQAFYIASTTQGFDISSNILTAILSELKDYKNEESLIFLEVLFDWDQGWAEKSLKRLIDEVAQMKETNLVSRSRARKLMAVLFQIFKQVINSNLVKEQFLAEFLIVESLNVFPGEIYPFQFGSFLVNLFEMATQFNLADMFWGLSQQKQISIPMNLYEKAPLSLYYSLMPEDQIYFIMMKLFNGFRQSNERIVHESLSELVFKDLSSRVNIKQNEFEMPTEHENEGIHKAMKKNDLKTFTDLLIEYIKDTSSSFDVVKSIEEHLDISERVSFGLFAIELVFKCSWNQIEIFNYFSPQTIVAYLFLYDQMKSVSLEFLEKLNEALPAFSTSSAKEYNEYFRFNFVTALRSMTINSTQNYYHLNYLISVFRSERNSLDYLINQFQNSADLFFLNMPMQSVYEYYLSLEGMNTSKCLLEFFSTVFSRLYGNRKLELMNNLSMAALKQENYAWVFTESKFIGTEVEFWEILATYRTLSFVLIRDLLTTAKEPRVLEFMKDFYIYKERNNFWDDYFPKAFEQRLFEASLYKNHLNVARLLKSKNPSFSVPIEYANKDIELECNRFNLEDLSKLRLEKIENHVLNSCIAGLLSKYNEINFQVVPSEFLHLALKAMINPDLNLGDFLITLYAKKKENLLGEIFTSPSFVCQRKSLYSSLACSMLVKNSNSFTLNYGETEITTILCSEIGKVFPTHPILQSCQLLIRMPQNSVDYTKKVKFLQRALNEIILVDENAKIVISINNETKQTLLASSLKAFKEQDTYDFKLFVPSILYDGVRVENDYHGVFRDWTTQIVDTILSRNFKLSASDELVPRFDSTEPFESFNIELELLGKVLGLAIKWSVVVNAPLPTFIWKMLMGFEIEDSDITELDTELFGNLMKDGAKDAGFDFEDGFLFQDIKFELEGSGPVNASNIAEYRRMIFHNIKTFYSEIFKPLIRGFNAIVPISLVRIFKPNELKLLINGIDDINVDDWQNNTEYDGYSPDEPVIQYFWQVAAEMTNDRKKKLLHFVHGSDRVPKDGFKALMGARMIQKFHIKRINDQTRLPSAHTW